MREQALVRLKEIFGYAEFRGQQADIIDEVAQGRDALVLMPTGGGKSLCYQIPGLLRDGLTVVVSPLIALMDDQVATLNELGLKAAALNSTLTDQAQREIADQMRAGELDFLYLAPERLLKPRTLHFLQSLKSVCSPLMKPIVYRNGGMIFVRNTCNWVSLPSCFPMCRAWH